MCLIILLLFVFAVILYYFLCFSITSFITISPIGVTRSAVIQSSFNSTLYYINVTWTPSSNQIGTLQVFCFHAQNSIGLVWLNEINIQLYLKLTYEQLGCS